MNLYQLLESLINYETLKSILNKNGVVNIFDEEEIAASRLINEGFAATKPNFEGCIFLAAKARDRV